MKKNLSLVVALTASSLAAGCSFSSNTKTVEPAPAQRTVYADTTVQPATTTTTVYTTR